MLAYLSTAYANLGQYEKALELLDEAPSVKEQVRADGLLLGNRCLIYIQMNQLDKAADCLTRLEAMVKADKDNALGGDVVQSARCLRIRLNASKGWATDVAWVKSVAASGQPPFYAASNQLMLGQVLLADHNKAGAKAALEKAAGYSTNLWACRRAAELLAGLEREYPALYDDVAAALKSGGSILWKKYQIHKHLQNCRCYEDIVAARRSYQGASPMDDFEQECVAL